MKPLTNATIAKLLRGDRSKRIVVRDAGTGLVLRIGARGARWSYTYQVPGAGTRQERTITLGDVAAVSLAEARAKVEKLKADIAAGGDPAAPSVRRAVMTLAEHAAAWSPSGRKGHIENERRGIRLALAEMGLGHAKPDAVKRADLAALVQRHRTRPATARLRLGSLRRFYEHLNAIGVVETNPVGSLPKSTLPAPPQSRSGYPSAAEVQRLWQAADRLPAAHGAFLRALVLLPLRRGELAELRAGEVNLGRGMIALSAKRTKSDRAFELPLSDPALTILQPLVDGLRPEDRVFKLAGNGALAMSAWSKFTKRVRRESGVENVLLHDMRRLFVSECAEHGVGTFDDLDGLLNHAQSASRAGVAGVYQRSARREPRAAIMQAWADLVTAAVESGHWPRERNRPAENVVELRGTMSRSNTER